MRASLVVTHMHKINELRNRLTIRDMIIIVQQRVSKHDKTIKGGKTYHRTNKHDNVVVLQIPCILDLASKVFDFGPVVRHNDALDGNFIP